MNRIYKKPLIPAIIIASMFLTTPLFQTGWIKEYGGDDSDFGHWVESTPDGGFIVTGMHVIQATGRSSKLCLIKTDYKGDTLWIRTYEDTKFHGGANSGRCVQVTSDDGYIVVGTVGASSYTWLLKLNSDGDTMWTRVYEDAEWCYCVRELDSGYIISGDAFVVRPYTTTKDLLLLRVDDEGKVLWSKTYGSGEYKETGFSLQVTPDGGFIVTGTGPEHGLWTLRTDSTGGTLWSRVYKLGNQEYSDRGNCIEPTADGGWIITGGVDYDVAFQGALCLLRIDSLGDTLWTRIYDYGSAVEVGNSVKQTPDGGFIVVGEKDYLMDGTGAIWLLKTDSTGDILWTRTFGGSLQDRGDCIQLTADNGYVITGFTSSYSSNGTKQVLLMKLDSLGYSNVAESVTLEVNSLCTDGVLKASLKTPEGLSGTLSLYNSAGQKIDSQPVPGSVETTFDTDIPVGVYFVSFNVAGTEFVRKVVVID